jgi:hypothetical protein
VWAAFQRRPDLEHRRLELPGALAVTPVERLVELDDQFGKDVRHGADQPRTANRETGKQNRVRPGEKGHPGAGVDRLCQPREVLRGVFYPGDTVDCCDALDRCER